MSYDAKIERISEILSRILHLMGGRAYSKTKLVKLLYLLDVIQSRRDKPRFSGVNYVSYYYGPYSDDIEESIDFLEELGYISVMRREPNNGNLYYLIQLKALPQFGQLADDEKLEIREILLPLARLDLEELLDITYATPEFSEAPFGEAIVV